MVGSGGGAAEGGPEGPLTPRRSSRATKCKEFLTKLNRIGVFILMWLDGYYTR